MATVRPFHALVPAPGLAARVASPPYDVVSTNEARALAQDNDASFLRISRPEVGLPPGADEHSDQAYAQGARALADFVARGILVPSDGACFWLYAQTMGEHRQVGLVACASVDDYDRDIIKKHEQTRPDKEDDRVRHIDALAAHDEPVFLTYHAHEGVDAIVDSLTAAPPYETFRTDDGIGHELWGVPAQLGAELERLFAHDVDRLYVADGHHRSAAASRVHANRAGHGGDHGAFLVVLFPHKQLQILAYNRLVRDPQGRSAAALLELLRARFDVHPTAHALPPWPRSFTVYVGGAWYLARVRPGTYDPNDVVAALDCSLVQDQLLEGVFGIADPRRDPNVDFVGGVRGAAELERRVQAEGWSLAVHMYPTQIEQLLAVSDAGRLMPPKSTWFEPKLRSGLFVHPFSPLGRVGLAQTLSSGRRVRVR